MSLRRAALALGLCLALSGPVGCHPYRFTTGSAAGTQRVQEWQHIYGFGGAPGAPFDLERACGGAGVAEFGSYVSWVNALVTLGTLTFYAPRTAYAVCAQ
jgi:hypothetical protein